MKRTIVTPPHVLVTADPHTDTDKFLLQAWAHVPTNELELIVRQSSVTPETQKIRQRVLTLRRIG